MHEAEQRWQRSPVVLWRRTARGVLVRPLSTPAVVLLAGTGTRLWELLEQPRTVAELVDVLAGEYEGHRDEISRGLACALQDLAVKDLVRANGR